MTFDSVKRAGLILLPDRGCLAAVPVENGLPDVRILCFCRAANVYFHVLSEHPVSRDSEFADLHESADPDARLECFLTDRHAVTGDHFDDDCRLRVNASVCQRQLSDKQAVVFDIRICDSSALEDTHARLCCAWIDCYEALAVHNRNSLSSVWSGLRRTPPISPMKRDKGKWRQNRVSLPFGLRTLGIILSGLLLRCPRLRSMQPDSHSVLVQQFVRVDSNHDRIYSVL